MLINCPKCHCGYEVPDLLLDVEGRTVRCAQCQTVWSPENPYAALTEQMESPEAEGEPPPLSVDAEVLPDDYPLAHPAEVETTPALDLLDLTIAAPPLRSSRHNAAFWLAWVASGIFWLAGAAAVYINRDGISLGRQAAEWLAWASRAAGA